MKTYVQRIDPILIAITAVCATDTVVGRSVPTPLVSQGLPIIFDAVFKVIKVGVNTKFMLDNVAPLAKALNDIEIITGTRYKFCYSIDRIMVECSNTTLPEQPDILSLAGVRRINQLRLKSSVTKEAITDAVRHTYESGDAITTGVLNSRVSFSSTAVGIKYRCDPVYTGEETDCRLHNIINKIIEECALDYRQHG